MTEDQFKKFGNRCPDGYTKLGILGYGSESIVWLAIENQSKMYYALKQYSRKMDEDGNFLEKDEELPFGPQYHQEILFYDKVFNFGGGDLTNDNQ